jgi:2-keto-3-deoxy-L-rhamnonate aldolase RhmA
MGWGSVPEQIEAFNRDLVVGIQIETAEALADLDGVLSVPGVDIAVIGNDDLSLGMGLPGRLDSPEYIAAVERVIAACERHGVLPGIAGGDPAVISHWVERGMRAIWYASDICAMWAGVQKQLADLRDALEGAGWESGA